MGFGRIQSVAGISDKEARNAARFLVSHARNAGDAWNLLEACGLLAYAPGEPAKARAEKSAVNKPLVPGQ